MQNKTTTIILGILLGLIINTISAQKPTPLRIVKKASDFSQTRYLDEKRQKFIKDKDYLTGVGEADYELSVPKTGWYEFYAQAAQWGTELFLDGKFLIYTPFKSGIWKDKKKAHKVLNVYLTAGKHTLTISRRWHPGLPYMRKFFFEPAKNITGMVRVTPIKDHLVFRCGEKFPVKLQAGKSSQATKLVLSLTNVETEKVIWQQEKNIPKGTGNITETINLPTKQEGIFDFKVTDAAGQPVARMLQCCVIDSQKPAFPATLKKELLYTIDCTKTEPDYQQGETRVTEGICGSYRESGDKGREKGVSSADWFAYTLKLPTVQEPYMLEIEYPDDDERTTPIVLVEWEYGAPEPALGYFSGGIYPLSNKMQIQEFYFFPRSKNPRVLFYNWCSGQRSAVANIKIYKITSGFPSLKYGQKGRMYGMYQEEPLRHVCNFGAMPDGDNWLNLYRPTERVGQLMNYVGTNLWNPTIAVYQAMLWPGKSIPGYRVGILPPGPTTLKEPMQKDMMRLMLLTCEKYGLNFVGDLHIPANAMLMRILDKRFGGKGTLDDDGPHKPWLSVSNKGEVGLRSSHKPYYNALYPGIQEWAGGVIRELAERYKDSPAFKGVSIRFMGWANSSWQCFPSIEWGYGDYTIDQFEKETGIKIPVGKNDPKRFKKRFDLLMQNHYRKWVEWRNKKMYEYHNRLARILTETRPDLKLYLFLCGADYAHTATPADYEQKGWAGVLKETSLDLDLYRNNPAIVAYRSRGFPDGGNRGQGPLKNAKRRDRSSDLNALTATAKSDAAGSFTALYLGTNHEGGYVKFEKLGYPKDKIRGNKQTIYPDSTVYPAGIHYLERFANAMADANITWLSEGSHGYSIGQPQYLQDFLKEYRSLPVMGMNSLGKADPVALWYATKKDKTYFYVVNRTWYSPVSAEITFNQDPKLKRLSTGKTVSTENNLLKLELAPYQLLAFEAAAKPKKLQANIPKAAQETVKKMYQSAAKIVNRQPTELTAVAISPVEMDKAKRKLAEAKELLDSESYWKTRQALVNFDLIRIYEAFQSYPTGLFHRKAPQPPPKAMLPKALLKAAASKTAKIINGKKVSPSLTNEKMITWKDNLDLELKIPYSGLYKIWYAYPISNTYGQPKLLIDNKPLQDNLPSEETSCWGKKVTQPLSLSDGTHRFTLIKTSQKAGVFFLGLEPLYKDLKPGDFAVIGPFEGIKHVRNNSKAIYQRLEEELPAEKEMNFSAEYPGFKGKKVKWTTPVSGVSPSGPFDKGYIDTYKTFGVMSNVITCAVTNIKCPKPRKAAIKFGADYWARLILNGQEVFHPRARPIAPPVKGEVTIPVTLNQGENVLVIKNHAGSAGNGFWVSITDPGDLEFSKIPQ